MLAAVSAALLLAACGGDDEEAQPGPEPPPPGTVLPPAEPPPTEPPPAEAASCTNDDGGFSVEYPADWHTNEEGPAPACTFFDPEPIEVPEATDFFGAAVTATRQPVAAEEVLEGVDPSREVLEREVIQVGGQRAFRMEAESTGEGLLDAEIRYYQVVVAVDGESIILATYDFEEDDYERNREVVDRMAESLRLTR